MATDRMVGGVCGDPFPIYSGLADTLATAHVTSPGERDATVAHVLGTCAGYAYADIDVVSTMMTRLGLPRHACVRITQTVDAMLIFSTAYLIQSECGRVVIVCFRGTEPGRLGNWLGDADVGRPATSLSLGDGAREIRVHAGFHRNTRATSWAILQELTVALQGRSLADPAGEVEHPLEALYVTGHSLGGAMAALFALTISGNGAHRSIADRLRAVYTFGQPMAIAEPLPPPGAEHIESRLFRHIVPRDPVPALPPASFGPFAHFGREYRFVSGAWQRSEAAVGQLRNLRGIPSSLLAFFATERRRRPFRYSMADHAPDHYIAALRPAGRVTEFGD